MTRNHEETVRSYVVKWVNNKPEVRTSHWVPGYTEAHFATPKEALAHAGVELIAEVGAIREKWLNLQMAGAHLTGDTLANAFGQFTSPTIAEVAEDPTILLPDDEQHMVKADTIIVDGAIDASKIQAEG